MNSNSLKKRFMLITSALTMLAMPFAAAQAEYPTKPITIVAPYGTGGSSDLASRSLAGVAPEYLGQPMLVINRTGAGGVTGSAFVSKSRPDGYTLLLARVGSQAVSPAMRSTMPYKYDDFTMLGLLEINPTICATSVDKPYKTMEDVVAAIKKNPGKLSYSSSGVGAFLHIATPYVLDTMGVEDATKAITHVPYKGGGGAATAAVAGHVDLVCVSAGAVANHIAAGKLRGLLVTSKERLPLIPDVPTVAELGYPEMENLVAWSALYGPPNMDPEVTEKLRAMLQQVKNNPTWVKFTKSLGNIPSILDGPQTEAFVEDQYQAFRKLVEKLDMKI